MREIITLSLLIWGSLSMLAQNDQFVINGKISEQYNNKPIMLITFDKKDILQADTTTVANGSFTFRGKEYLKEASVITTGNYSGTTKLLQVILERGTILVDFNNASTNKQIFNASGTYLNDLMKSHSDSLVEISKEWEGIASQLKNGTITTDSKDSLYSKLFHKRMLLNTNFKKQNISNLAGEIIIKRDLNNVSDPYFDEIYEMASEELRTDPAIVAYLKNRDKHRQMEENRKKSIGKPYINFELKTLDGLEQLSDHIGKSDVVLVDFWASWCGPCINEIPHLKKIYEQYAEKGLGVVSISVDADEAAWRGAVARLDMPWTQLLVKKEEMSKLMSTYHIRGIPYMILVDKEGLVIDVNLRGKSLDDSLKLLLDK